MKLISHKEFSGWYNAQITASSAEAHTCGQKLKAITEEPLAGAGLMALSRQNGPNGSRGLETSPMGCLLRLLTRTFFTILLPSGAEPA